MALPLSAGLRTVLGNALSWCMALVCKGVRLWVMCFEEEKLNLRECQIVQMYLRRLELEGVGGCQVMKQIKVHTFNEIFMLKIP